MTMTPEAKRALSTSIRSLRARLLEDLHAATESAYRLSVVREKDAGLDESARARRQRLTEWIAEQGRAQAAGKGKSKGARTSEDFRREAEKQAAYTLLNRLVLLRLMEAGNAPLRAPAVVTGGWESRGYQDFRQLAPGLVRGDETEGYAWLLQSVFEDLATELPGLYGPAGVAELVPVPAATLRHVIDTLNAAELESCWTDDMTLGWVYQFWNDPEREALDAMVKNRHAIARHEIASKTQMFTDRYIVDWLLQNSLGHIWLAICQKHGWVADVSRNDAGRWPYFVANPLHADEVAHAPESLRQLEILDPAVGSGHFLVVALRLLVALYHEESRHRGEVGEPQWSDRAIVEHILAHNLHGIDIDPRAVQIAAAALWLSARRIAPGARPERINVVASNLGLANLPADDPALLELRQQLEAETGISGALVDRLLQSLSGADHLGSLLRVDHTLEATLDQHEDDLGRAGPRQLDLYAGEPVAGGERARMSRDRIRSILVERLEAFLGRHTAGDDLGLRLRGEQLTAGVRFVRMIRENHYDLVVANPPYHSATKLAPESCTFQSKYPLARADLFAAFMLRAFEFLRPGGRSATVTLSNWMFIKAFSELRAHVLSTYQLVFLADLGKGAFSSGSNLINASAQIFQKGPVQSESIALRPHAHDDMTTDAARVERNMAGLLVQEGFQRFDVNALKAVPEWPLVYWWGAEVLASYQSSPLVGDVCPARFGLTTGDNDRFCRSSWEIPTGRVGDCAGDHPFVHLVHGAKGEKWFDTSANLIKWRLNGGEVKLKSEHQYGTVSKQVRNTEFYFKIGLAFSAIGNEFAVRAHRFPSVFSNAGLSLFPADPVSALASLLSARTTRTASDLAPGIRFDVGDVNRLPLFAVANADEIHARVESAFTIHESHREPSVEFKRPGPSPWRHAQDWAQLAIDRPENTPLPPYTEQLDPEPATDHLSFAFGVALGRFGNNDEGILDPATAKLDHALPHGILFLDTTLDATDLRDGLGHPACAPLHEAWAQHSAALATKRSLRDWLALDFFKDVHKGMYEGRPIYWPLSSASKTFVAWVNIHRFTAQTLRVLLADHLTPTLKRLEGELADLRITRDSANKKAARAAEKQLNRVLEGKDELTGFIALVEQCADRGAPPSEKGCPAREQDARYVPNLDDGVMINAAGLWPLLEPQWKEPKKCWKALASESGTGYDWSHLAMRYWPTRVDEKCQTDPSLAVAHGCFWRYHPERAWAWELRLQDEIGPEFRIVEPPYRPGGRELGDGGDAPHRAAWLRDHEKLALAAIEKEATRRMGRNKARARRASLAGHAPPAELFDATERSDEDEESGPR
jgi:hypothetical protein